MVWAVTARVSILLPGESQISSPRRRPASAASVAKLPGEAAHTAHAESCHLDGNAKCCGPGFGTSVGSLPSAPRSFGVILSFRGIEIADTPLCSSVDDRVVIPTRPDRSTALFDRSGTLPIEGPVGRPSR